MSKNKKIIISIILVLGIIVICCCGASLLGYRYARNSIGLGEPTQTEAEYKQELEEKFNEISEKENAADNNNDTSEPTPPTTVKDTAIDGVGDVIVNWNFYPDPNTDFGKETGSMVVTEETLKNVSITGDTLKASISEEIIQESAETIIQTDSSQFKEFSDGIEIELEDGHILFTMKIKGVWSNFLGSDSFGIYMIQEGQDILMDKLVVGDNIYELNGNFIMRSYSEDIVLGTNKTIDELSFTINNEDWTMDSYQILKDRIDITLKKV